MNVNVTHKFPRLQYQNKIFWPESPDALIPNLTPKQLHTRPGKNTRVPTR